MKRLLLLFIAILIVGCCVDHKGINSPRNNISELNDATIALVKKDVNETFLPYCTGVWVNETTILTANHCTQALIEDTFGASIFENTSIDTRGLRLDFIMKNDVIKTSPRNGPKTARNAIVKACDKKNDLALLSVNESIPKHVVVKIKKEQSTNDGTHVNIIGHVMGYWWSYIEGVVSTSWSNIKGPDLVETKVLQISSPTWVGSSGGGAFDDDGYLLGIASWVNVKAPNISFYIHHDVIVNFLDTTL